MAAAVEKPGTGSDKTLLIACANVALNASFRSPGRGIGQQRLSGLLVVAEVALAFLLLVGAGVWTLLDHGAVVTVGPEGATPTALEPMAGRLTSSWPTGSPGPTPATAATEFPLDCRTPLRELSSAAIRDADDDQPTPREQQQNLIQRLDHRFQLSFNSYEIFR
jgi:hypothetical protein